MAKKIIIYIFAFIVVSVIVESSKSLQTNTVKISDKIAVSVISLISQPHQYEGQRVRVWGYIEINTGHNILYLHKEDFQHDLTKNGLWLDLSQNMSLHKDDYNRRYVILEGVFNSKYGELGMCSGSLTQVNQIAVWKNTNK